MLSVVVVEENHTLVTGNGAPHLTELTPQLSLCDINEMYPDTWP